MRALVASALALVVLCGCEPELRGECTSPVQCPTGTSCVEGLRIANWL